MASSFNLTNCTLPLDPSVYTESAHSTLLSFLIPVPIIVFTAILQLSFSYRKKTDSSGSLLLDLLFCASLGSLATFALLLAYPGYDTVDDACVVDFTSQNYPWIFMVTVMAAIVTHAAEFFYTEHTRTLTTKQVVTETVQQIRHRRNASGEEVGEPEMVTKVNKREVEHKVHERDQEGFQAIIRAERGVFRFRALAFVIWLIGIVVGLNVGLSPDDKLPGQSGAAVVFLVAFAMMLARMLLVFIPDDQERSPLMTPVTWFYTIGFAIPVPLGLGIGIGIWKTISKYSNTMLLTTSILNAVGCGMLAWIVWVCCIELEINQGDVFWRRGKAGWSAAFFIMWAAAAGTFLALVYS